MLATRQAIRLTANKQLSPSLAASARSCASPPLSSRRPADRHRASSATLTGSNEPDDLADTFCPSILPALATVAVAARPNALPKAAALRAVAPRAAVLGRARASAQSLDNHSTELTVEFPSVGPVRGYAAEAGGKFTRSKPHMNIGCVLGSLLCRRSLH